ncbi:MAG: hypothetical protein JWP41_1882 [Ramlibacter sp.]|nr:hypothetical protein [Ramlibacter sp.]
MLGTQQDEREKYMTIRAIWWALDTAAAAGIKTAAMVAPHLEVDIFPHRNFAGCRKWWHLDAYLLPTTGTAWRGLCIAFGGWTVDVCWKASTGLAT